MPGRQTQAAGAQGITLIEVLAALAVITFAIIPLTVLFRYSIHGTREAGRLLTAVQLTDGVLKNLLEMADYKDVRDPNNPKIKDFIIADTTLKSYRDPKKTAIDLSPRKTDGTVFHFSLAVLEFNPTFKVITTEVYKGEVETDYQSIRRVKKLALTVWWKDDTNRREFTLECLKPDI